MAVHSLPHSHPHYLFDTCLRHPLSSYQQHNHVQFPIHAYNRYDRGEIYMSLKNDKLRDLKSYIDNSRFTILVQKFRTNVEQPSSKITQYERVFRLTFNHLSNLKCMSRR